MRNAIFEEKDQKPYLRRAGVRTSFRWRKADQTETYGYHSVTAKTLNTCTLG